MSQVVIRTKTISKNKMKEIEIYSLGEWDVFWAVIHNFLGFAHKCTYSLDLKPSPLRPDEMRRELLNMVVEKEGKLHIYHLFEPFVEADLPQYARKFYDNGMKLIKEIIHCDGLEVEWDIPAEEKLTLLRFSPPLYDRIFSNK